MGPCTGFSAGAKSVQVFRPEHACFSQKTRARPGFEPGTSRTQSENHTPRPTGHDKGQRPSRYHPIIGRPHSTFIRPSFTYKFNSRMRACERQDRPSRDAPVHALHVIAHLPGAPSSAYRLFLLNWPTLRTGCARPTVHGLEINKQTNR